MAKVIVHYHGNTKDAQKIKAPVKNIKPVKDKKTPCGCHK